MSKRSIVIFPSFSSTAVIDELRARFDPLANKIGPHITLVFPFESDMSKDALRVEIARCAADIAQFRIVFSGISGHADEFLFLNLRDGFNEIMLLHNRLYGGVLARFLNNAIPYQPHLTVGRIADKVTFALALSELESKHYEFRAAVESIIIEEVLPGETSKVESEIKLARPCVIKVSPL